MDMDSYLGGCLLVFGGAIAAVIGLLVMRKVVDFDKLRASHDVGGYLLSVVGTLYAVLLGLVVVDAMQKFETARQVTEREANALADVFIMARCLPEPKRGEIRKFCNDYAHQVVQTEWSNMNQGAYCPVAHRFAVTMMQNLTDFEPVTENQKALYPEMVSKASEIWKCRRARLNMALNGVAPAEWLTLIAGAVITVFFTFFFGLENLKLQIAMTAMVAMLISLNLYLVLLFGYPFSGDIRIGSEAFKIDLGIFENHLNETGGLRPGEPDPAAMPHTAVPGGTSRTAAPRVPLAPSNHGASLALRMMATIAAKNWKITL